VLTFPLVLVVKELNPIAVLYEAVVLASSASLPTAVLQSPVLIAVPALSPIATLLIPPASTLSNAVFPKATLSVPTG